MFSAGVWCRCFGHFGHVSIVALVYSNAKARSELIGLHKQSDIVPVVVVHIVICRAKYFLLHASYLVHLPLLPSSASRIPQYSRDFVRVSLTTKTVTSVLRRWIGRDYRNFDTFMLDLRQAYRFHVDAMHFHWEFAFRAIFTGFLTLDLLGTSVAKSVTSSASHKPMLVKVLRPYRSRRSLRSCVKQKVFN